MGFIIFAYTQLSKITSNKNVLDLGCNTEYGSEILSRTAQKVIGVDVSEKAISTAIKQYNQPNINFQLIDGKKLPFNDNSFDIIISCQVIEHIVDYTTYLNELKRVLSPSGIAFITTPNAQLRLDPGMKPWNIFHVREYKYDELKNLLTTYFPSVKVMGLFAEEHLYSVEKNRVTMIRNASRKKQPITLKSILKKAIPTRFLNLRTSMKNTKQNKSNKPFEDIYSLNHLFYQADKLNNALDFLAICSKENSDLTKITENFK